jgi:hypothetical protein
MIQSTGVVATLNQADGGENQISVDPIMDFGGIVSF